MSETIIKVENLSKQYRLGTVGTGSFKEDVHRFWASIRGKEDPYALIGEENDRTSKSTSNYVWSLRDVNFEVKQGDILGVIGKNGAGKSTLLKILSKVTTPTTGSVKAKGRIASLLEVGTGFHPELTGRENIYLNGAILGMRKHEITRKLDEIITFAGVERYIDTPVKRYSSGMYVRLAFAVAAHLENEILIIDEVLAVGDAEFQSKCLNKMGDISSEEGRTVLFVSHNLEAIKSLCTKGLYLNNGKINFEGDIKNCVKKYLTKKNEDYGFQFFRSNYDNESIYITSAKLFINNSLGRIYANGDNLDISFSIKSNKLIKYSFEILIKDQFNTPILFCPIGLIKGYLDEIKNGEIISYSVNLILPFLAAGIYYFDIMIVETGKKFYDCVENILSMEISSNYIQPSGWNFNQNRGQGSILLKNFNFKKHYDI
jgi:lipopolysaccharide transport system ATP-binding protein